MLALRARLVTIASLSAVACFGSPDTLGLPCSEHAACFDGQVCGVDGRCVLPDSDAAESIGDGHDDGAGDVHEADDDANGYGESGGDEDGEPEANGDGDGEAADDGDGDDDGDDGEGAETTGDGDGGELGPLCGNNIVDSGESCDGTALAGKSCADFGYGGGTLSCSAKCEFVLSDCCYSQGQQCNILASQCCGGLTCNLLSTRCH